MYVSVFTEKYNTNVLEIIYDIVMYHSYLFSPFSGEWEKKPTVSPQFMELLRERNEEIQVLRKSSIGGPKMLR